MENVLFLGSWRTEVPFWSLLWFSGWLLLDSISEWENFNVSRLPYLESQVAQNTGPLCPNLAHSSLKVALNCEPLAFQVCGLSEKG